MAIVCCSLIAIFHHCEAAADADAILTAEHRTAKEASILDSIASLFGAGDPTINPKKPAGPPPKPGPIYRGPVKPPVRRQQQAASIQRPVALKPPTGFKQPFFPQPPKLATLDTKRNTVVQPGKSFLVLLSVCKINSP